MKFITNFLNAKHERELKRLQLVSEIIKAQTEFMLAMSNLAIVKQQNKCFSCKHKYEKKEYEVGAIIGTNID